MILRSHQIYIITEILIFLMFSVKQPQLTEFQNWLDSQMLLS